MRVSLYFYTHGALVIYMITSIYHIEVSKAAVQVVFFYRQIKYHEG